MADSTYHAGTISVAAGGSVVTGTLTAFLSQVKPGDTLIKGNGIAVIDAVLSNTGLALKMPWNGATMSEEANYLILRTSVGWHSVVEVNTRLTEIIAKIEAGRGFKPDATGTLTDRALNDTAVRGFIFVRTDVVPFELYIKASAASGDWAGPTSVQGDRGEDGGPGLPGAPGADGEDGADGQDGQDGSAATIEIGSVTTLPPGSAAIVENVGSSGAARLDFGIPAGADGLDGFLSGRRFAFSGATVDADPGVGALSFDHASVGSVSALFISDQDAAASDVTAWLDSFDDSTNTANRGSIFLQHGTNIDAFAEFVVTGAIVSGSGYRKVPVELLGRAGAFADGIALVVNFTRTGDRGSDGIGAGDVLGPSGAMDGALALFNGTTGKLLKTSGTVPASFGLSLLETADRGAAQTALGLSAFQTLVAKDTPNGYAGLDSSGKLLASALPALAITNIFEVANQVAMLALAAETGDIAIRTDLNKTFGLAAEPAATLANWKELRTPTDVVQSVAGLTGPITAAALKAALSLAAVATSGDYADLNGKPAVPSVPPVALRQIATHGLVPNGQHGTAKQIMSRTQHFARDNVSAISLVYSNWFINNASGEAASGGVATVTASIEYPAGTFIQVKFGGSTSTAIASGGTGTSDSVAVQIPDGAAFWVRTFATQAGSGFSLYQSPINMAGGSAAEVAASGLTDKTMSGTITDGGGNLAYGPTAVLGMTNRSSVLILGASNTQGIGDTYDASGFIGLSDRSIGPQMAFVKSARGGDRALDLVNAHTNRVALAAYCTDVVLQLGTNDLSGGASGTTLAGLINTIVGYFPGIPTYICTVPPMASSTDNWATTANQTANNNVERTAYNNAVRAKTVSAASAGFFDISTPLEPSLNAGIWKAPGFTTDGAHASQLANLAVLYSRAFEPSQMVGALEAPLRLANVRDVGDRQAHDVVVTPQSLVGNVPVLDGLNFYRANDIGATFTSYIDNAGVAGIVTRRARGTMDLPSAVLSGDAIGGIWARGYGATGFAGTGRGSVMFYATQNWTDAAHGTASEFATTANGSTSRSRTLYLDQDGSVTFNRIGTTASSANAYLDSAASNKLLRSTSSALYKTSVEDLSPERADAILNLRPVWYRSAAPADRADWSWYGLIAEEVAEVEPRLVHWAYREDDYEAVITGEDEEGGPVYGLRLKVDAKLSPDGVQYERLTVMLLDVIKRQDAAIADLARRIAMLEV